MQWSVLGSDDRARILIVDGSPSALQRLAPLVARLDVTLELYTLLAPGAAATQVDTIIDDEACGPATDQQPRDPRALVFEGFQASRQAARLLRGVRSEDHFRGTPALVSLALSELHQLDFAEGFDDFLLSPYSTSELRARIYRAARRTHGGSSRRSITPGLSIDYEGHEVEVNGQRVQLTSREFRLVAYLMQRPGTVVPREQIVADVWGRRYHGSSRTVDTHIRRLRMKLSGAVAIETVRGSGYKLVDSTSRSEEVGALLPERSASDSAACHV